MTSFLSADLLLVFPAFLMGSGLGSLVGLILSAKPAWRTVRMSMAGSAIGALIFIATAAWWPPIIGPFVACPAFAITTVLLRTLLADARNK